jgi:predicted aspartyl protease
LISRRSFLTQAGILAVGAASVWWLRDHVIWPKPRTAFANAQGSSGWLGFSDDEPRIIIIDAELNGTPVRVLLDSGAQSSVIDRGLAERLGIPLSTIIPVVAFGVSGSAQVGRSASIDLRIGGLVLSALRAAVLEIEPIATASRRHFSVILGQDILEVLVADIDFPGGRVSFHDPERHLMPPGAFAAPARLVGRELLVPVTVEETSLEVVLDTGASGALALSPQAAQTAGLLDGRDVQAAPSITFGGLSNDQLIRARALSFAGADYPDVRVHVYTPAKGARIPPGLLGVEVLERFRVLLNLGRGELHLIPGEPRPRRRRRVMISRVPR